MLLNWDRLNLIRTKIERLTIEYEYRGEKRKRIKTRECEDLILEWLIDCYLMGEADARQQLGHPVTEGMETEEQHRTATEAMYATIFRKIDGKTFEERVSEYAGEGDVESIMRVAETEAHRDYNDASLNTATALGAKDKTWNCMFVNSRDTHMYLHGTTVPIDAEFYTFMGNHAMYPGQFGVAEEDINCHCWLTYR